MFRRWMLSSKRTMLDEDAVKAWILHRMSSARRLNYRTLGVPTEGVAVPPATIGLVSVEANGLTRFVDFLIERGLWSANPFRSLNTTVSGPRSTEKISQAGSFRSLAA
jgi:hypothetical protein